jgi:hypothetical protein
VRTCLVGVGSVFFLCVTCREVNNKKRGTFTPIARLGCLTACKCKADRCNAATSMRSTRREGSIFPVFMCVKTEREMR